jgi:hypothetical protein
MTPDWTATQEPFSVAVAQLYILETVEKIHKVPMCWRARQSEYKDVAKLLAQVWREKKKQEMHPAKTPGPSANGALNNNGGN